MMLRTGEMIEVHTEKAVHVGRLVSVGDDYTTIRRRRVSTRETVTVDVYIPSKDVQTIQVVKP